MNWWYISNRAEQTNADSFQVQTVSVPRDTQGMCLYDDIRPVLMEHNTAV